MGKNKEDIGNSKLEIGGNKFQIPLQPELGMRANFKFQIILEEFFYFLTSALVVGFVLEFVYPRIVLAYINLSYLLLFWLIAGIILIISKKNT